MREYAGRAVLPRAARRPDLGGHLGDPAADHRPGAREARRRPGRRMTELAPAVAGAAGGDRPAPAVRAALGRGRRGVAAELDRRDRPRQPADDGQRDPLPLRQPEVRRAPRPALLPEPRRRSPSARTSPSWRSTRCVPRWSPATRPRPASRPSSSRAAGSSRAAPPRRRCRPRSPTSPGGTGSPSSGPNCMGVVDFTANSATYIGDVSPYLPRGGVAGIAQSGSVTDAFIHSGSRVGFSRIISCGSEVVLDVCDYLAYCLDDPETTLGHPVRRGLQAAGAVPRPGRPRARSSASRSWPSRSAAATRPRQRPSRTPGRSRARRGSPMRPSTPPGSSAAPTSTSCSRRPSSSRAPAGPGRGVGRGRTGVVTVSTGEASLIADLVPRTGVDLPPIPEAARAAILEQLPDDGLHRQPARPVGRRRPAARLRRLLRGDGGVGRVRRPGPRPRLPVPVDARRGRDGQRRHLPAARRDSGPARHPARLRLADVGRASARDQGRARRAGRWGAPAARGGRGVQRHRLGGALAGPARHPCRRRRRTVAAGWPALARRPDVVRRGPDAGGPAERGRRRASARRSRCRAREPGAPARGRAVA